MAKVNVVWKGMYVGTEKMTAEQIRKAEYAGFTITYANQNLCTDSGFGYNPHSYGCRFKGKRGILHNKKANWLRQSAQNSDVSTQMSLCFIMIIS